jgi:hypothetical protein
VRLDRLRAQEEPRGDLPVRQAGGDELRNLELLRGQLAEGRGVAPTRPRTGRPELGPRTIGPELAADGLEALERGPEAHAGVVRRFSRRSSSPQQSSGSRALPSVRPAIVPLGASRNIRFVGV